MQTDCSGLDEVDPVNTETEVDREGRVATVPHAQQIALLDFESSSMIRPHLGQYSGATSASMRRCRHGRSSEKDSPMESCSYLAFLQLLPTLLALIHIVDNRPALVLLEIQSQSAIEVFGDQLLKNLSSCTQQALQSLVERFDFLGDLLTP